MTRQLPPTDKASSDELVPSHEETTGSEHATASPLTAAPVKPQQRIASVDVLRGVALLGILAMNIVLFAWPMGGYENPNWSGGATWANNASWFVNSVLFSGKMMSLFSMLFGAGLVLMAQRAEQRGAKTTGVYYRRIFWLLCFGLIHAYLIWSGDILVMYALTGLWLYWFRNFSPRTLIILAVIFLLVQTATQYGFTVYGRFSREVSERVEANEAAGVDSQEWELGVQEGWEQGMRSFVAPTQEDIEHEIETYQGSYLEILSYRAPEVFFFHLFGFFFYALWGVGGRMLLGMALMKLDVFSAQRSPVFYRNLLIAGYGCGLLLTVPPSIVILQDGFDALQSPWALTLFSAGMVPMALGHAALVMLVCQAGWWQGLLDRLAAVGRMALTNYLAQSILCTTLFYGYGLGLFGQVDRWALWLFVLPIWALQLAYSGWWMSRFRYGPAEWLWRRLTYFKFSKAQRLATER